MSQDFDLTAKRLIWLPVTFPLLTSNGDENAEPVEYTVELQVELVDLDEFSRLFVSPLDADGDPRPDADPPATPERLEEWRGINDTTRALALVHDWRKVKANGRVVPFTEDNLRKLMRVPGFNVALFLNAYPLAYNGQRETREGNSAGSPDGSRASDAAE